MDSEDYTEIIFRVIVPTGLKYGVIEELGMIVSKRIDIENYSISVEHKNG